jgi:hypothetical protein
VTSCAPGLSTCGGLDSGADASTVQVYCANEQSDNLNCGACGNACTAGEACSNGACSVSCQPGLTLCGGDSAPLSCVNEQSDNLNCGACGAACGPQQVCSGGTCQSECTSAQTLCVADGGASYCANTQSDSANCGGCGTTCGPQQVCSGGVCKSECPVSQLCVAGGGLFNVANESGAAQVFTVPGPSRPTARPVAV